MSKRFGLLRAVVSHELARVRGGHDYLQLNLSCGHNTRRRWIGNKGENQNVPKRTYCVDCAMPQKQNLPDDLGIYVVPQDNNRLIIDDGHFQFPELRDAFYAVLESFPQVDEPVHDDTSTAATLPVDHVGYGFFPKVVIMGKDQAPLFAALWTATQAGLKQAYANGLEHGQSLLSALAKGEITVGDFENPIKVKEQ